MVALSAWELKVPFQPKVDLKRAVGAEFLGGWESIPQMTPVRHLASRSLFSDVSPFPQIIRKQKSKAEPQAEEEGPEWPQPQSGGAKAEGEGTTAPPGRHRARATLWVSRPALLPHTHSAHPWVRAILPQERGGTFCHLHLRVLSGS